MTSSPTSLFFPLVWPCDQRCGGLTVTLPCCWVSAVMMVGLQSQMAPIWLNTPSASVIDPFLTKHPHGTHHTLFHAYSLSMFLPLIMHTHTHTLTLFIDWYFSYASLQHWQVCVMNSRAFVITRGVRSVLLARVLNTACVKSKGSSIHLQTPAKCCMGKKLCKGGRYRIMSCKVYDVVRAAGNRRFCTVWGSNLTKKITTTFFSSLTVAQTFF